MCPDKRPVDGEGEQERGERIALFYALTLEDAVVDAGVVAPRVVALASVPQAHERKHPAELGVRAEFREEGAAVDMVVCADAVQRLDKAVTVLFCYQAAQECDAINACTSRQGELVRLGVLEYLVRILLGDGPRRESADADPCSDAANVVGELTCGVFLPESGDGRDG